LERELRLNTLHELLNLLVFPVMWALLLGRRLVHGISLPQAERLA
jgi:hypothetical protein